MSAAPKFAPDPRRRSMMAKVHLAKKELGLDDTTYRAALQRVTGKASSADCTEGQLGQLLDDFKAKGWKGAAPTKRRAADHPVARKARALWISLHQLGVVRNPSEQALEAFARRQLHVEQLQWADQAQGFRLIEALKDMGEKAGWRAPPQNLVDARGEVVALKVMLVQAQWARLSDLGAIQGGRAPAYSGLPDWANGQRVTACRMSPFSWPESALETAAARLGDWIAQRIAKAAASD